MVTITEVDTGSIVEQNQLVDNAGCFVASGLNPGDCDAEVALAGYVDAGSNKAPSMQLAGVVAGY